MPGPFLLAVRKSTEIVVAAATVEIRQMPALCGSRRLCWAVGCNESSAGGVAELHVKTKLQLGTIPMFFGAKSSVAAARPTSRVSFHPAKEAHDTLSAMSRHALCATACLARPQVLQLTRAAGRFVACQLASPPRFEKLRALPPVHLLCKLLRLCQRVGAALPSCSAPC